RSPQGIVLSDDVSESGPHDAYAPIFVLAFGWPHDADDFRHSGVDPLVEAQAGFEPRRSWHFTDPCGGGSARRLRTRRRPGPRRARPSAPGPRAALLRIRAAGRFRRRRRSCHLRDLEFFRSRAALCRGALQSARHGPPDVVRHPRRHAGTHAEAGLPVRGEVNTKSDPAMRGTAAITSRAIGDKGTSCGVLFSTRSAGSFKVAKSSDNSAHFICAISFRRQPVKTRSL